jgi:transcriptional regulator with XRE-family HTH domain
MHPGGEIRQRRLTLGKTISDLADASGLSRAMIADVENGKKSPTLRTLYMLATGLGCSVSDLLGLPEANRVSTTRAHEHQVYIEPGTGIERRLLSPALATRGMQLLMFRCPPGAVLGEFPPEPPSVLKHVTVLAGRMVLTIDGVDLELGVGDSVSWIADAPHSGRNTGDTWAEVLHVVHYGVRNGGMGPAARRPADRSGGAAEA